MVGYESGLAPLGVVISMKCKTIQINEIQIVGPRPRPWGAADIFVRGAYEAQIWHGAADFDDESVLLMGGTFSFGLERHLANR